MGSCQGNIQSVNRNIDILRKKKETLAKSLNISEKDIKEYDNAIARKIELAREKENLSFDRVIILKAENIIYISDIGVIKTNHIQSQLELSTNNILTAAKKSWTEDKKSIISKIDERIEEKEQLISSQEAIVAKLKPQIDSNEEIKKIENLLILTNN